MMRCRRITYLALAILSLAASIGAQTRQSLEERRRKALQEISEINGFLKDTQQGQQAALQKITLLNVQIASYNRLIDDIGQEIRLAERQIAESNFKVKQLGDEVERLKEEYARMVFLAYKNRGRYNKLVYILSARDFNEAYRRMKYFQQYTAFRDKQVNEIHARQADLKSNIVKTVQQKAVKESLLAEQRRESRQLAVVKKEQADEAARLKSKEQQLRRQVVAKQQEAQKLQREINSIIAEEVKRSKGNSNKMYDKLTPAERLVSNNFKDNRGRLPWPVERGIITRYFGISSDPLFHDVKINNNGIDVTTVANAEVRAVFAGTVTLVSRIQGNLLVMVRHGSFVTVYMNLSGICVKRGDVVKAKDAIGRVFTEYGAKTAVLHFEIWEETNKLDPEMWLIKK